jgi:hypothetical protein
VCGDRLETTADGKKSVARRSTGLDYSQDSSPPG